MSPRNEGKTEREIRRDYLRKIDPKWEEHLEVFRENFQTAMGERHAPAAWKPDLVVSMAGVLIRKAQDVVAEVQEGLAGTLTGDMVTARGGSNAAPGSRLARFEFPRTLKARAVTVHVIIRRNNQAGIDLNVELRDAESGNPLAPYRVRAIAPDGTPLADPVEVCSREDSAHFPDARPGGYTFRVEWGEGGACYFQLELTDSES